MTLVTVVMGSESKVNDRAIVERIGGFGETSGLLDQAFTGYTTAQILTDGQTLKQYGVRNGSADVVVGPTVSISSVVPIDHATGGLTYQYKDVDNAFTAPIEAGRRMSSVEIWYGSVCLAQADLYALHDVSLNYAQIEGNNGGRLTLWGILLILLLVIVICASGYVFYSRYRNVMRTKRKHNAGKTVNVRRH